MDELLNESYKGYCICAYARLDTSADDYLTPASIYQPVALIEWEDAAGSHRQLLCNCRGGVYLMASDARRIAAAMARRYIDSTLGKIQLA